MVLSRILWLSPFASFIIGYALISFLSPGITLKTPPLIGQSLNKAAVILSQKNLNLRIVGHKEEADLAEGTIVSQTPIADTPIKEQQSLYLVIARKPAPQNAPNLGNTMAPEAAKIIESQSLQPKLIPLWADRATHQCVAQYPSPEMASADQSVIIYTMQNQKPVIMPNLKRRSLEEVASFLSIHGISPELLHAQPTPPGHSCNNCIVTDQRPVPGSLIIINPDKPFTIQLQVAQ